jgi:hypothetical protein
MSNTNENGKEVVENETACGGLFFDGGMWYSYFLPSPGGRRYLV